MRTNLRRSCAFLPFFLIFILVRFAAFNRSLLQEIGNKLVNRKSLLVVIFFLLLIICIAYILELQSFESKKQKLGERLK